MTKKAKIMDVYTHRKEGGVGLRSGLFLLFDPGDLLLSGDLFPLELGGSLGSGFGDGLRDVLKIKMITFINFMDTSCLNNKISVTH
jgi:hypothetical protein